MMTFQVKGNLVADPVALDTGNGRGFQLRIASDRRTGAETSVTEFFNAAVFGDLADKFATAHKGDRVELSGQVRPTSYEKDGSTVHSYNLVGRSGTVTSIDDVRAARQAARTNDTVAQRDPVSPAR